MHHTQLPYTDRYLIILIMYYFYTCTAYIAEYLECYCSDDENRVQILPG